MKTTKLFLSALALCAAAFVAGPVHAQMGKRFPSERKVVIDPVTGTPLTFLTSKPAGDSKIYQTHAQWTSDGKWLVFRSNRVRGQAFAVNEETGDIVQLTSKGYMGMLCVAHHSMRLFVMRDLGAEPPPAVKPGTDPAQEIPHIGPSGAAAKADAPKGPPPPAARRLPKGPFQIVEINLEKLFADSAKGQMQDDSAYERVCGTLPEGLIAGGDMAIDATEETVYFRVSGPEVGKKLAPGTKIEANYGPRNMGAGPAGLRSMNIKTGEIGFVVDVPFQIGHVQTNPYVPGEIIFCWETGGKSPQRTWYVKGDGSDLRPLYPEAPYEWVTHEAVITKDEVAMAIMGHRKPGTSDEWGANGTREHPTGLAVVNLRTREMRIEGQTPTGSGYWHVHGSPDGRFVVGDDFARNLYLIDRRTGETLLLTTGHKITAADHVHPTFSADSTRIEIQSAMLSEDNRSMNICIVPVPESWLKRK